MKNIATVQFQWR